MDKLEGDELEATLLEAADDVANESALDTVRLTRAVRTLCAGARTSILTLTMM